MFSVFFVAWFILTPKLRVPYIVLSNLLCSLWACAVLVARSRTVSPIERRGWRFIALAMFLQGLSHGVEFWIYLLPQPLAPTGTLPSIWIQNAVHLVLMAGLMSWPLGPRDPGTRRRCVIDSLILGLACFFLFWQLGLQKMLSMQAHTFLDQLMALVNFLLPLIMFSYWAYLVLSASKLPTGPVAWLGTAWGVSFVPNAAYIVAVLGGAYSLGHWCDALVLPFMLCLGCMALDPRPVAGEGEAEVGSRPTPMREALPYLPLVISLLLIVYQACFDRSRLDWRSMVIGSLISAALVIRQLLAFRDLRRFSWRLEDQVEQRTSRLKEAQSILLRTERMNSIAMLGAGLTHDINNALTSVRLQTQILQEDLEPLSDATSQRLGSMIVAVDQAAGLCKRLMAFARQEEETLEELDLVHAIGGMEDLLRMLLPRKVTLKVLMNGSPLKVRCSTKGIEQILVNLIANARDAMPEGGLITVETHRVEDRAGISVTDTGTGMTKEILERIFEPLFTTKARGLGTGLGLSSVKLLVEGFSGDLQVHSKAGEGSTFIVRFPLVEEVQPPAGRSHAE